jgi:transglutaminase-like putative cysteine protease
MKMKPVRNIILTLSVLFIAPWCTADFQNHAEDMAASAPGRLELVQPTLASSMIDIPVADSGPDRESPSMESRIDDGFPRALPALRVFVTPGEDTIKSLAAKIKNPVDAYQLAVRWLYVSDATLNQAADEWLTPEEFLTGTPYYVNNPQRGQQAGDCEEKANTLVSIIRAEGVPAEDVRVVIGTIKCGGGESGHAWVELLVDGKWLSLDPCYGPYWDDEGGKVVHRKGVPFNYFASHSYPVSKVWAYYNDIYFLDTGSSSGNAPASWLRNVTKK